MTANPAKPNLRTCLLALLWVMLFLSCATAPAKTGAKKTDEEQIANFRQVAIGRIKPGRLFCSSNPANPEVKGSLLADRTAKEAGIKAIMDLANNEEEIRAYPDYADRYVSTANSIMLGATSDLRSEDFNRKMGRGLVFLTRQRVPWLICSDEGKDRAGFAVMLIAALCGASVDEITDDFMLPYEKLLKMKKGSGQYEKTAENTVRKMIMDITRTGTIEEARECDLAEAAAAYLRTNASVSNSTLRALRSILCD